MKSETTDSPICVFYSHGPHYVRVLKRVRAHYPQARIHALVPPTVPIDTVAPYADVVRQTELARYSLRALPAVLRLFRSLRAERYAVFVVIFDSTRLRLTARASGARERYCVTLDGRWVPLRRGFFRQFAQVLARRVRGEMAYRRVRRSIARR